MADKPARVDQDGTKGGASWAAGIWKAIGLAGMCVASLPGLASANVILAVNQALIDAFRKPALHITPPPSAADIAFAEIAMYDAVNAATGLGYKPYSYAGGIVAGVQADAAAYSAGYTVLSSLFPAMAGTYQATLQAKLDAPGLPSSTAAAATIPGDYFGDDTPFCSTSDPDAGFSSSVTRCFDSFSTAAAEAGESRILGGIHFSFDNTAGLEVGKQIADYDFANAFTSVPEPGSLLLLGTAATILGLRRRGEVVRCNGFGSQVSGLDH